MKSDKITRLLATLLYHFYLNSSNSEFFLEDESGQDYDQQMDTNGEPQYKFEVDQYSMDSQPELGKAKVNVYCEFK